MSRDIGLLRVTVVMGVVACLASGAAPAGAESCPNAQLRTEANSLRLPDCRAYELVSPPYKDGHPIITGVAGAISGEGGEILAGSLGAFGGTQDVPGGPQVSGAGYSFSRTASGWITTPHSAPAADFSAESGNVRLVSRDLSRSTFVLNGAGKPLFSRDLYLRMPNGSFAFMGPMKAPQGVEEEDNEQKSGEDTSLRAGSGDLSSVLFTLRFNRWPGDTTEEGPDSLYEASLARPGAEPRLVGVRNAHALTSNAEAELISKCGTTLTKADEEPWPVSETGSVEVFTASECAGGPTTSELYARINGALTAPISEPKLAPGLCTGACAAAEHREGVFRGASASGKQVFFATEQPLLNTDTDTTSDLYDAELDASGVQKMTQVSLGDGTDPAPGSGADLLGVLGLAEDGSRAYIAAEGVLTQTPNAQGITATAGRPNVYMVEPASGRTVFVTTLSPGDAGDWSPSNGSLVQLTPNGAEIAFASEADLTPDDTSSGVLQLFEYELATGRVVRISAGQRGNYECPVTKQIEAGFNCDGNTNLDFAFMGERRSISTDGAFVYFSSSAALTPNALSDPTHIFRNVYEYHDGEVSLISNGQDAGGEQGATLFGTDESGANVFFETLSPLVAQDTDTQADIYDARIGGGFPQLSEPVGCSGEGCRGTVAAPPLLASPGTLSQLGGSEIPPAPISTAPARRPLTKAQQLRKALSGCRKDHNKHKRVACERHARKRYGAKRSTRRLARK